VLVLNGRWIIFIFMQGG